MSFIKSRLVVLSSRGCYLNLSAILFRSKFSNPLSMQNHEFFNVLFPSFPLSVSLPLSSSLPPSSPFFLLLSYLFHSLFLFSLFFSLTLSLSLFPSRSELYRAIDESHYTNVSELLFRWHALFRLVRFISNRIFFSFHLTSRIRCPSTAHMHTRHRLSSVVAVSWRPPMPTKHSWRRLGVNNLSQTVPLIFIASHSSATGLFCFFQRSKMICNPHILDAVHHWSDLKRSD